MKEFSRQREEEQGSYTKQKGDWLHGDFPLENGRDLSGSLPN